MSTAELQKTGTDEPSENFDDTITVVEKPYLFVEDLLKLPAWQIARLLTLECGGDTARVIQNIKFAGTVMGEDFQDAVANHTFGDKLAGDIGARSTQGHPKTDYGEPRFGSGWDIDTK
jgi:hypothetical protein